MDALYPTPALAQESAIERLQQDALALAKRQASWEQSQRQMMLSVMDHESLPSTMQIMADAFVHLCPSKAMAIFLLSGDRFALEAEAGLPQRPKGVPLPLAQNEADNLPRSNPILRQILASGVKLCMARPLLSGNGVATGAVTVFDRQQELLDDATRETVLTLCDFARLAMEHRQLYDQVTGSFHYDALTGLPNRVVLEERLQQAIHAAQARGAMAAVCLIDLDRFRLLNDTWGQELGDACIRAVSERLASSVREGDLLARQASDEFVLVLCDLTQVSDATNIGHRILRELAAPLLVEGRRLTISASIGISIFPSHGDTPDILLRHAHIALQKSKQAGQQRVRLYSSALGREHRRAAEMADALTTAVAQHQLRLVYQPIYTRDRKIVGFEALLRWIHPQWGQIRPGEFIPIAEKSGLIASIGDWVISEVCRQAMEWEATGLPPVKLFVNVSGVQLEFSNFSDGIAEMLQQTGLPPDRLVLELTESWIISDLRGAAARLQRLRDLGIGVAIDDFGTGYATFSYLQSLPLDTLKIDRSFVRRLRDSPVNLSTVRAITGLAQQLGLKTIVEGVETEHDFRELSAIGCDMVQGFLFSPPLKPKSACLLLKQQQCA